MAHACEEHFPTVRAYQEQHRCEWLTAEKEVLGYNHAEVGGELLTRWSYPKNLILVVSHQQAPASAPSEVIPLMAHLHAAKYLATSLGAGVAEDGFMYSINSQFLFEWGFSVEVMEKAIPALLDRSTKLLRDRMTQGAVSF